jgi:hypothetical protein
MRRDEIVRLKKKLTSKSRSGDKHAVNYSISAIDRGGQKMIVGEGFKSASRAEAAMDLIAREFGLATLAEVTDTDASTDGYNLLTAD